MSACTRFFGTLSIGFAVAVGGCTITQGSSSPDGGSGDAGPAAAPDASTEDAGRLDAGAAADGAAGCTVPAPSKGTIDVAGNASFAAAQALELGEVGTATLGSESDVHFYSVTLPACEEDGVLTVSVAQSADMRTQIKLYDEAQTELASALAADATTSPFRLTFAATAGKKYLFTIGNYAHSVAGTLRYEATATYAPVPDAYERNDTFADAKPAPAGPFDVYVFAGDQTNGGEDRDYFTIVAPPSATKMHAHVQNRSTNDAPQRLLIELYDGAKNRVDGALGSAGQADIDAVWALPSSGDYYVLVTSYANYSNSTAPSTVTLTVE